MSQAIVPGQWPGPVFAAVGKDDDYFLTELSANNKSDFFFENLGVFVNSMYGPFTNGSFRSPYEMTNEFSELVNSDEFGCNRNNMSRDQKTRMKKYQDTKNGECTNPLYPKKGFDIGYGNSFDTTFYDNEDQLSDPIFGRCFEKYIGNYYKVKFQRICDQTVQLKFTVGLLRMFYVNGSSTHINEKFDDKINPWTFVKSLTPCKKWFSWFMEILYQVQNTSSGKHNSFGNVVGIVDYQGKSYNGYITGIMTLILDNFIHAKGFSRNMSI